MSKIRLVAVTLAALAVFATAASAAPGPGWTSEDAKYIMPVSQIKPGMKGYGLTVFKGTKIEKFDVEVLGVLKKVNTGKDLILVKMKGGPITARGANIIQGMSGSPVYVNGKMIGAVAYGESFPREPLAMLTPVEDMLDSLDPSLPSRPSGHSSDLVPLSAPVKVNGRSISNIEFSHDVSKESEGNTLSMVPLTMPLMVSGMSQHGIDQLKDILGPFNLSPMAAPGASGIKAKADLVPGASVGVALATGDVELTGIGTLTYRRGNKVVAFGHPMLGIGAIDAPMTTAYVYDIFPSLMVSHKIASMMEVKGRIFQDRPFSIGGEIGKMPHMIPVKVYVDDQSANRKKTLNVNVIDHPLLASRLIGMVAGEAVYDMHPTPGDATAKVHFEVDADKVGKIERDNIVFDPVEVPGSALEDLQRLLGILSTNKFHPIDVKSVKVSITITGNRSTANLESAFVEKSKYQPGETMDVGLVLRPYNQNRIIKHVKVPIPEYAQDGRYTLQISGGDRSMDSQVVMAQAAGGDDQGELKIVAPSSGLGSADNIQQMIDKFLEQEKNNDIVAKLVFPSAALSVEGEKLSRLPGPLAQIMKSNRSTGLRAERDEVKVVMPTEYVVTGGQTLQVAIERRDWSDSTSDQRDQGQGVDRTPPSPDAQATPAMDFSGDFSDEMASTAPASVQENVGDNLWVPLADNKTATSAPKADAKQNDSQKAAASASPAPPSAPTPSPANTDKPVARQASVWRQDQYSEFNSGKFDGTTASTSDDVRISPKLRSLAETDESFAWAIIPDGAGGAYIGTGPKGEIIKVARDGKASVLFDSDEVAVQSLLKDKSGTIYAGTSPHGLVYKITAGGKPEKVLDAEEKYITSLAEDAKGDVFAGVGDGGVIYKISGGKGEKFVKLPDDEIVSLATDPDGNLYAGTGPDGVVYKVTASGGVSPVYDATEQYASAVAVDKSGNLYVGTSPKGAVYKITPSGSATAVLEKSTGAITDLAIGSNGVYATTDGQIYVIGADDKVSTIDTGDSRAQFTAITTDGEEIFAGAANPATVFATDKSNAAGVYESQVHDAKSPARWGVIRWTADTPQGTSVYIETRTGNSASPDSTWSAWTGSGNGETVKSPAGRFIQYRAKLNASGSASPALTSVSVAFLAANQAPKITVSAPQPGTVWSGKQTVKWAGTDPDKDTLTYDLFYSADNGATWKPLRRGVQAKAEANGKTEEKPKPEEPKKDEPKAAEPSDDTKEVEANLRADIESNTAIPQDVKERLLAQVPEMAKQLKDGKPVSVSVEASTEEPVTEEKAAPSKETSYSWDTTKVADGKYLVKVVASDRTSNADGYLTAEKVSSPVVIVNKPPKLALFAKSMTVGADKSVTLPGYTYQNLAEIDGVQYRIDGGDWAAASADDGIFDSVAESFTVRTAPLDPGQRTIEVKVIDAAGNSATAKQSITIK